MVRSGGQIVTIGLMGGKFSLALPAMVGQMRQFRGSVVGNLEEATEMLDFPMLRPPVSDTFLGVTRIH